MCVYMSVFVCNPIGLKKRPWGLLSERHHCILSKRSGHVNWTDMVVVVVCVWGGRGVGGSRENERKCEIEQLFLWA